MSLKAKIKGAVDKAFAAAGDLVQEATFEDKTATTYNFATGETSASTKKTVVDILILDTKKVPGKAWEVKAIIKAGPNMDMYDKVVVDGVKYHIVEFMDSGYHVEMTLKKEA